MLSTQFSSPFSSNAPSCHPYGPAEVALAALKRIPPASAPRHMHTHYKLAGDIDIEEVRDFLSSGLRLFDAFGDEIFLQDDDLVVL
jgi:hypothetical protein